MPVGLPFGPSSGSTTGYCSMPTAPMLAAIAFMSAFVCGTFRTFFGDFFKRLRGTNTISLLASLAKRLLMVSLLWLQGSAQNPRMNPCPSARPGEGEQEENRQGGPPDLPATLAQAGGAKIGGCRFCSCWGCQGSALASPTRQNNVVAQRHLNSGVRDGSRMAETRNPGSRDLKGLGSRQPGRRSRTRSLNSGLS